MIIDELEASLSEATIDATNTEVSKVAVEANADEYITSGSKVGKINETGYYMEIYIEK